MTNSRHVSTYLSHQLSSAVILKFALLNLNYKLMFQIAEFCKRDYMLHDQYNCVISY